MTDEEIREFRNKMLRSVGAPEVPRDLNQADLMLAYGCIKGMAVAEMIVGMLEPRLRGILCNGTAEELVALRGLLDAIKEGRVIVTAARAENVKADADADRDA